MNKTAFTYVIVIILLVRYFNFSDLVSSVLILPAFMIIPFFFGEVVIKIFRPLRVFVKSELISRYSLFIFSWLLGSHFIATLFLILTLFEQRFLVRWLPVLIMCTIVLNLIYEEIKSRTRRDLKRVSATSLIPLITVSVVAICVIYLTKQFVPFPRVWGYTYFMLPFNVLYAYRTVEGGFFYGGNWPDWLYSSLIYSIFGVNPLYFMWSAPFIIGIIHAIGIYGLTLKVSSDSKLAMCSGIFGMIIHFTEWPPNQFMHLKSNIIMFAVFPWLLLATYEVLNRYKCCYEEKKILKILILLCGIFLPILISFRLLYWLPWRSPEWSFYIENTIYPIIMVILPSLGPLFTKKFKHNAERGLFLLLYFFSVVFTFMHPGEPFLYLPTLYIFTFAYILLNKNRKWELFLKSYVIFILVYVYLQLIDFIKIYSTNLFSWIFFPELKFENTIDFSHINSDLFTLAYPHALPYILLVGVAFALFSKIENILMTFMLAFALSVLFLPDLMAPRAYSLLKPFSSYILSLGFLSIIRKVSRILGLKRNINVDLKFRRRNFKFNCNTHILVGIMMVFIIFPPLITHINEQSYKFSLLRREGGYRDHSIADYEYNAAFWIKTNLPEKTVIVSDYMTIQILGSIGNTIWLPGRSMDAKSLDESSQKILRIIKNEVFKANSSDEAFHKILTLLSLMHVQDKRYMEYAGIRQDNLTFIIVFSSRTLKWINQQDIDDVTEAQYENIPLEYLKMFSDAKYFKLLYKDKVGYLYIFKLIQNPSQNSVSYVYDY